MKIGIFLINLDDRNDRLDSSTKQLNKVGLEFTRVSALPSKDVEESIFLTDSVLACWKSHLKTYSILVESDLEYALILEDDFLLKNPKKFSKFLTSLETERYDLLQIGFILPGIFNRLRWIFEELEKVILIYLNLYTIIMLKIMLRIPYFNYSIKFFSKIII